VLRSPHAGEREEASLRHFVAELQVSLALVAGPAVSADLR
jgi:hypothetical protein